MTADDWRRQGERLLSQGAPILAYDTLADGLAAFPGDVRLRQLLGLALARSGAPRAAVPILERLRDEGHTDEETLGLLARAVSPEELTAEGDASVLGKLLEVVDPPKGSFPIVTP